MAVGENPPENYNLSELKIPSEFLGALGCAEISDCSSTASEFQRRMVQSLALLLCPPSLQLCLKIHTGGRNSRDGSALRSNSQCSCESLGSRNEESILRERRKTLEFLKVRGKQEDVNRGEEEEPCAMKTD